MGAHTVTASYGGDGNFTASTSAPVTQYVNTNLSSYPKLSNGAYNLGNANLRGAYLVGAGLAGANLSNSNLAGAVLTGANLAGANLSSSNLSGANFANANLAGANLSSSNLSGANFANANLAKANLSGTNLAGANLSGATLTGATGLKTANVKNVAWSNTMCPDSTNSNNDSGSCVGHF